MLSATSAIKSLSRSAGRSMATATLVAGDQPLSLPELPYGYSALEPYISAEIMELHHSKHHNTYVNNYNNLLAQYKEAEQKQDSQALPKLASGLHFNGGGTCPPMI